MTFCFLAQLSEGLNGLSQRSTVPVHASAFSNSVLVYSLNSAPSATLAAGTRKSRFQGCHDRSPVAVWHFVIIPRR